MNSFRFRLWSAAVLCLCLANFSQGQELLVTPRNQQGVYQPKQSIQWNVQCLGATVSEANYVLKLGGLAEIAHGSISLTDGQGQIDAALENPGWLLAEVSVKLSDGKQLKALGGALVSPGKITPALPPPEDFDAFWGEQLKVLAAVPMNARLEPATAGKPEISYFHITMDNIRDSKIRGQLARPVQGEKMPALLIVQWAGVYPLQRNWVLDRAAEGWLVLNINAHDLPIDKPESFYTQQASGPLQDYPAIGNDDRETSYFLRMYLSCYRAAQYLAERPDWDGHTLVVTGGSQGGLQSLLTAALHPKITAAMASVPAGCDLNGPQAKRIPGWPSWYWKTRGKNEAKVRHAAEYFDLVNFAPRINCPILVGVGLIDTVCPPPGIFAALNLVRGPKEVVLLPLGEHGDKKGSHRSYNLRFSAWNQALVKGLPAPLQ